VDGVFAGDDAPHRDDFLPDRRQNLLAVDDDEIVRAAAVIAIEGEETGLATAVPGNAAGRVLHEQIEVVRMIVGPVHRDEDLGLGIDLAFLCIGRDREQRQEEQESDHLERLEQHHAERVERLLARIETEVIHHGGVPGRVSNTEVTWVSVSMTASENTRWVAASSM